MAAPPPPCPANSFRYNATICACDPGRYLSSSSSGGATVCAAFDAGAGDFVVNSGVAPTQTLLESVLPLDNIRRINRPDAVILWSTLATLVAWLVFCIAVRFGRVDGGRSVWFRIRWWISRLDSYFDTWHWLDEGKAVMKRKTELGGTFSVAGWILFVGLFTALLYQLIAKRSVEVHKVRPANAPDLLLFVNDMEFNITTVSSMSCSHLRGLDKLVMGTPGSIDFKIAPLGTYVNYSCYNTSRGPTLSFTCSGCQVPRDSYYVMWQFVDLPNDPATAVGFQFNLTAKKRGDDRHVSYVSGTLKSGTFSNDTPKTFRGADLNILKFHLFPQRFIHLKDLRLIQPLFRDFLPGSSFSEASGLQSSLQSSKDGLVNVTLYVTYLSDYIVEIDKQNVLGLVTFFADVGGLYVFSLGFCLYALLQCEARIKKLRTEDSVMRNIRSQGRAQRNWDKVRRYVVYTWGHSNLDMKNNGTEHDCLRMNSFCGISSLQKVKRPSRSDSIYREEFGSITNEMNVPVGENNADPETIQVEMSSQH